MHEYSVMKQLVAALLDELQDKEIDKVKQVRVEVGDLTFLGENQLKFAYEVLSKDTILEGSELKVLNKPAKIHCSRCGYEGGVKYSDDHSFHYNVPVLSCPECDSKPEVIQGKEMTIVGVTAQEVD
ncbi:MAG: hydrogenase maturation nickel metallochaperone HypA [Candidatus Saliniplasma sp.]